ncbi:hypothetical protein D3C81_1127830 [compost metagenome]
MKIEKLQEYLNSSIVAWALTTNRVDTHYDLKTRIGIDNQNLQYVSVNKVGVMVRGEDPSWNFIFSITITKNGFDIDFFLDDVEEDIADSLDRDNYEHRKNVWAREYSVSLKTFDEVKEFLNKHVWKYDFGYFY